MAGDVEHVVDTPENPVVAVIVALGAVAGEVQIGTPWPFREVGLDVSRVIAPDRAEHRWPWLCEREQTTADLDLFRFDVEQRRLETGKRRRGAARFRRCDSRQR